MIMGDDSQRFLCERCIHMSLAMAFQRGAASMGSHQLTCLSPTQFDEHRGASSGYEGELDVRRCHSMSDLEYLEAAVADIENRWGSSPVVHPMPCPMPRRLATKAPTPFTRHMSNPPREDDPHTMYHMAAAWYRVSLVSYSLPPRLHSLWRRELSARALSKTKCLALES